jgi:hypothetical protein
MHEDPQEVLDQRTLLERFEGIEERRRSLHNKYHCEVKLMSRGRRFPRIQHHTQIALDGPNGLSTCMVVRWEQSLQSMSKDCRELNLGM